MGGYGGKGGGDARKKNTDHRVMARDLGCEWDPVEWGSLWEIRLEIDYMRGQG